MNAPEERQKITGREAETHERSGNGRVFCFLFDVPAEVVLDVIEIGQLHTVLPEGFDDGAVLDTFLYDGLYVTLRLPDGTGDAAHLADVDFTDDEEARENDDDASRERGIHHEKENERSDKLHDVNDEGRERLCYEEDYIGHVLFHAVKDITAMETLHAAPF